MSLFGHDANIAAFEDATAGGRLHHAWLLAGPEGIGKAAFARAAAAWLLAQAAEPNAAGRGFALDPASRTARLLAGEETVHPDLVTLSRLEKDKGERARLITIDQVRGLSRLFGTSGSYSDRRVVIVDAVDDLEANGANAILKNLEEPPTGALFLLVSHAPGRLLPTIRSRCRLLRFDPLDAAAMAAALAGAGVDASEHAALVAAGGGSPGRALALAGLDVGALDAALDALIAGGDPTGSQRIALAKALSVKAAAARYALFLARVPQRIAHHARGLAGEPLSEAIDAWAKARDLAAMAPRLSLDVQTTVAELAGIAAGLAPRKAPVKG